MPPAVTVSGADQAATAVGTVGRNARNLQPTLGRLGAQAARQITGIPVDTGRLAGSIRVLEATADMVAIGSQGVPYAGYVFDGTRYMDAQPPTIPPGLPVYAARQIAADVVR